VRASRSCAWYAEDHRTARSIAFLDRRSRPEEGFHGWRDGESDGGDASLREASGCLCGPTKGLDGKGFRWRFSIRSGTGNTRKERVRVEIDDDRVLVICHASWEIPGIGFISIGRVLPPLGEDLHNVLAHPLVELSVCGDDVPVRERALFPKKSVTFPPPPPRERSPRPCPTGSRSAPRKRPRAPAAT